VPIQLAQFWLRALAISNAEIKIFFSNEILGNNFIKQHPQRFEITKMQIAVSKINLLRYLL